MTNVSAEWYASAPDLLLIMLIYLWPRRIVYRVDIISENKKCHLAVDIGNDIARRSIEQPFDVTEIFNVEEC